MKSMRSFVLLATASAVVAVAVGQDAAPPARPAPPAAAPPPAASPPAASPPAPNAETPAPQDASGASAEEFIPTEELGADAQVTFPVDI